MVLLSHTFLVLLNQSKVNFRLTKGNERTRSSLRRKSSAVRRAFYKMPGAPAHSLSGKRSATSGCLCPQQFVWYWCSLGCCAWVWFWSISHYYSYQNPCGSTAEMLLRHTIEHLLAIHPAFGKLLCMRGSAGVCWADINKQFRGGSYCTKLTEEALIRQREQIFAYWLRKESIEAASWDENCWRRSFSTRPWPRRLALQIARGCY